MSNTDEPKFQNFNELPLAAQQKMIDEAQALTDVAWREVFQLQESMMAAIRNNPDEPEAVVLSTLAAFAEMSYSRDQVTWMWALMIYRSARAGLQDEPA